MSEWNTRRKIKCQNDRIPPLMGIQQLYGLTLDMRSPRFLKACENLGILPEEAVLRYY